MTGTKSQDTQPDKIAQVPPTYTGQFDQMQVMQALIEIQKDLSSLNAKTDRLISDVAKADSHIDSLRLKFGRAEGIGVGAIALLSIFGLLVWWAIGGQINNLRDQVIRTQQVGSDSAPGATAPDS